MTSAPHPLAAGCITAWTASASLVTNRPGLHRITRTFRAARALSATVAGEEIQLERGEHVGANFQYAYTPEAFRWLLHEQGGLEIVQEYFSPDDALLDRRVPDVTRINR
jgi:hypothetical protein